MIFWHDFETASEKDLHTCGIVNYLTDPSTRVLMLAYAFDDGPVTVWEPEPWRGVYSSTPESLPQEVLDALTDPFVTKAAFNTSFERLVWLHKFGIEVPIDEWYDVMIHARYLSIPGDLEHVGIALQLDKDKAKIVGKEKVKLASFWAKAHKLEGDKLIEFFCKPAVAAHFSMIFGQMPAVFRTKHEFPNEWEKFRLYCGHDVLAERAIGQMLVRFPIPAREVELWHLDQHINGRGIPVDIELARAAIIVRQDYKEKLLSQIKEWSGIKNPNADPQVLKWARGQGYPFAALSKGFVYRALNGEGPELTELGRAVLLARGQSAKTAGDKYEVLLEMAVKEGNNVSNTSSETPVGNRLWPGSKLVDRSHQLLVRRDVPQLSQEVYRLKQFLNFLGSSRAGRWSSYGVQFHNLPRPVKMFEDPAVMARAIALLRTGDMRLVEAEFPNVMDVISACVRGVFIALPGGKVVVSDLNAIENRVLGWVAHCLGILNVFKEGKCPYLSFGARMQKIAYAVLEAAYNAKEPWAKKLRQDSKPAVLGCGYMLSGGEEITTPKGDITWTGLWGYAKGMGVEAPREFWHDSVNVFRGEYLEISGQPERGDPREEFEWKETDGLWHKLEQAALYCVKTSKEQRVGPVLFEMFHKDSSGLDVLRVNLPSGRGLHYLDPEIDKGRFGKQVTYGGQNQKTKQWERIATYGGKWTENIVQAIARDLLAHGMMLADERGGDVRGHVHDELICHEWLDSGFGLEQLNECMTDLPWWGKAGVFMPNDLPLAADGYEAERYRKG